MTVIYPEGVGVQGNLSVKIVLAIANEAAPSLATEINAASSLDISCFLYADGWNPSVSTSKVTAPRRLCSRQQLEQFGADTYQLADLVYTFGPQAAPSADVNKAMEALDKGLTVYAVERLGLAYDTSAFAVGQYVNLHKIILGEQSQGGDTTDESAEFRIVQPVIYAKPPMRRVVLAA